MPSSKRRDVEFSKAQSQASWSRCAGYPECPSAPHTSWQRALSALVRRGFLSSVMIALLAWSTPALAQQGRATVRLDGRAILRLSGTPDRDADTRADDVERRLASVLQHEDTLPPVQIEQTANGAHRTLSLLGVPLVTVTPEDAQDHLTSADALSAQWSRALDSALARAQKRRRGAWGGFGGEVVAAIRAAFAGVAESAGTIVPRALASLLVILMFWAIASAVRFLLRMLFRRVINDLTVENLLKQVAYYAVWALGMAVAVDALGLDKRSVATGLGLTGLALGFALKDILSNFVSGILLLALRPFRVGDQIIVGETEGTVERVVLRATQLRTYDGRAVLVPNAELFTSRVTNNTAAPIRRASFRVFLGYDVDAPKALEVMVRAVQSVEGVLAQPAPSAQLTNLGQDDLEVELRFWTDSRRSDFVETTSDARKAVVAAARAASIPLPDPDARFVVFRNQPPSAKP